MVRFGGPGLLRRAAAAPFEVWYELCWKRSEKVHLLASARRVPRAVQLRVLQAQAERRGRLRHRVSYYNLPHARDGGVARGAPRVWRDLFGTEPRHGHAAGVQVIYHTLVVFSPPSLGTELRQAVGAFLSRDRVVVVVVFSLSLIHI